MFGFFTWSQIWHIKPIRMRNQMASLICLSFIYKNLISEKKMEEKKVIIKQKRIFNELHSKYLEDYLLENSLDNHPDIQLIFSENTKVLASCLSVYLVFPFLESELSNLLAEHISLPDYALVDFNNALKACFLDKPIDRKKTNNENELFMDCIESERTSNSFELTSDNKKDDNNLTLNVTESELPLNQIENQKVLFKFFLLLSSLVFIPQVTLFTFELKNCNK